MSFGLMPKYDVKELNSLINSLSIPFDERCLYKLLIFQKMKIKF